MACRSHKSSIESIALWQEYKRSNWIFALPASVAVATRSSLGIGRMGAKIMSKNGSVIGVSDHGGWAILVTVARDGTLLDRRRVELVDDTLPSLPHHHEGQMLPMDAAVALVERVRASAERHAVLALDAVAIAVPHILGIALRSCPQLPPTIAERIKDYRARNVADWVMYRKALASAAEARGWPIHWYDAKNVLDSAAQALHVENLDAYFLQVRSRVGPPWNKDHKLAMASAIVTAKALSE
ncbi:MAG: hypothetical protein ABI282_08645 [Candidatus Baltobacteraceae bacterium]